MGTALTEEQARVIRRYADEAVICYDSDEAGRRATQRAIPILKNAGLLVRVVTVPGGKDPDEFFRQNPKDGPERFKRLTAAERQLTQSTALAVTREKYDLSTEDGKKRYLQEAVAQVLGPLRDRIELDLYAGKLSEETGVGKESIMASAQAGGFPGGAPAQAGGGAAPSRRSWPPAQWQTREKKKHMRAALAEEGIITYLYQHQDKAAQLADAAAPGKVGHPLGPQSISACCWARLSRARPPSPPWPRSSPPTSSPS